MVLFEPPANVSTSAQMMEWINNATSMWLFQGIIGTVFVISLLTMLQNQTNTASKALGASAFIAMIIAVFARVLNLIPTWYMSIWVVLVGISAVWMFSEGTK